MVALLKSRRRADVPTRPDASTCRNRRAGIRCSSPSIPLVVSPSPCDRDDGQAEGRIVQLPLSDRRSI